MPGPDLSYALGLTPVEAVRYFRSKGIAVTENWHDLCQEAQARAFTVTGITKLDLMQDIRGAVDAAIKEGKTEQWFLNELTPILKKKGWWGKKEVTDPDTGEVRYVRQGSPARLKLIYRQNTQSAYMAGRYKQQLENADSAPYLRYIAVLDQKTRPAHAALHNMVFRFDDPFWGAMYPPNGWNCRCRVAAYSESRLKRRGLKVESSAGHMVTREVETVNRQTGEVVRRTVTGYRHGGKGSLESFTDAGFSYNPGKAWLEDALANVPEPAQAVTWKDMGLRPLRDVPAEERLPAPELLPIADSQEEAEKRLAEALGFTDERQRIVETPMGSRVIRRELLAHMVEKRPDARERFANYVLPTLIQPFEVWLKQHEDGKLRENYIGLFRETKYSLLIVVRINRDGSLVWNIMQREDKKMDKHREGMLVYKKKS